MRCERANRFAGVVWAVTSLALLGSGSNARAEDAKTGGKPSTGQFIGRYLCYYLSSLLLGLGFIWVAFDSRKQGWHDKLAGTLVVRR